MVPSRGRRQERGEKRCCFYKLFRLFPKERLFEEFAGMEDVATEDTETPLAARKAADEDCALRRKPSLMHGIMEDERNYFRWKVRRIPFGNLLPCRTKCVSVYSVVAAPTKFFEVPKELAVKPAARAAHRNVNEDNF